MTDAIHTRVPAVRIEFSEPNGIAGKVWLRHPIPEEGWIDISHYVTAVKFDAEVNARNIAHITFVDAATGAPNGLD